MCTFVSYCEFYEWWDNFERMNECWLSERGEVMRGLVYIWLRTCIHASTVAYCLPVYIYNMYTDTLAYYTTTHIHAYRDVAWAVLRLAGSEPRTDRRDNCHTLTTVKK